MVLDKISDGASRHSQVFDQDTKRLAFLMCLPMIDGVFAMLLVTGAVNTFSSMVMVALTVFAGAGSLAVLYSATENRREALLMVGRVAPLVFTGALAVALIAPVFEQLFYVGRLSYAAGIVLIVIAGKMVSAPFSDKFSTPGIIVTGMVLSVKDFAAFTVSFQYVLPAIVTVTVALMALSAAAFVDRKRMDLNYIRTGGAAVLFFIALSLFGADIPQGLSLAVFGFSVFASLEQSKKVLDYFFVDVLGFRRRLSVLK